MSFQFPPQGAEIGKSGVHYRVWAPLASRTVVQIVSAADELLRTLALSPCGRGYFHGLDQAGQAGSLPV